MVHLQRPGYLDVWLFSGDSHYFWDLNGTQINSSLNNRLAAGTWTLTVRNAQGLTSGPYTLTIQSSGLGATPVPSGGLGATPLSSTPSSGLGATRLPLGGPREGSERLR